MQKRFSGFRNPDNDPSFILKASVSGNQPPFFHPLQNAGDRPLAQTDISRHFANGNFVNRMDILQNNQLRAGQSHPLDELLGIQINGLYYFS